MPYLLNTVADIQAMLARIGAKTVEDLFAPIPAELRLKRPLAIPPGMDEITLSAHIAELAKLLLTAEELEKMARQLSDILDYAARLNELDTDAIAPTASVIPIKT